jgi:hypothetical protein
LQDDAVIGVVEREEVREGAADIDTDHPGHSTHPDAAILEGEAQQDQSTQGCRAACARRCATMQREER